MRAALLLALVVPFGRCSKATPPATPAADTTLAPVEAGAEPPIEGGDSEPDASDVTTTAETVPADDIGQPAVIARKDAPSLRYAKLGRSACEAELGKRKIPFTRAEPIASVRAPVRLSGPLHGVTIHSESSAKRRAKASFEIFDCRLVLALDDFAELVAKHDVSEILHMSAFRSWRDRGCTSKGNKQHCGALAVDVGAFVKKDGTRLVVDRDFNGKIGQGTCTTKTKPSPATPEAEALWGFVCEAARRALFNVVLTPNFNAEHHNHVHLEVTPGVDWMLVH